MENCPHESSYRWTFVGRNGDIEGSSSACTTSSESGELINIDDTGSHDDLMNETMVHHPLRIATGGCDQLVSSENETVTLSQSPESSAMASDRMYFVLHTRSDSGASSISDSDSDYVRLESASSDDLTDNDSTQPMMDASTDQCPQQLLSSVSDHFSFFPEPCKLISISADIESSNQDSRESSDEGSLSDKHELSPISVAVDTYDVDNGQVVYEQPAYDSQGEQSPVSSTVTDDHESHDVLSGDERRALCEIGCELAAEAELDAEGLETPMDAVGAVSEGVLSAQEFDQLDRLDEPLEDSVLLNVLERFVLRSVREEIGWRVVSRWGVCFLLAGVLCFSTAHIVRIHDSHHHNQQLTDVRDKLQHYTAENYKCQHLVADESERIVTLQTEVLQLRQQSNSLNTELSDLQLEAAKRRDAVHAHDVALKERLNRALQENQDLQLEVGRLKYTQHPGNVGVSEPAQRDSHSAYTDGSPHVNQTDHERNVLISSLRYEVSHAQHWAKVWQARYSTEHSHRVELENNSSKSLQSCLDLVNSTLLFFLPKMNASRFYDFVVNATDLFDLSRLKVASDFIQTKWGDLRSYAMSSKPYVYEYFDNLWSFASVVVSDFVKRKAGSSDNDRTVKDNKERLKRTRKSNDTSRDPRKPSHSTEQHTNVNSEREDSFRRKQRRGNSNSGSSDDEKTGEKHGSNSYYNKYRKQGHESCFKSIITDTRKVLNEAKERVTNTWGILTRATKRLWDQHKHTVADIREKIMEKTRDFTSRVDRDFSRYNEEASETKSGYYDAFTGKQSRMYAPNRDSIRRTVTSYTLERFRAATHDDLNGILLGMEDLYGRFWESASRDKWLECQSKWWAHRVDGDTIKGSGAETGCADEMSAWQLEADRESRAGDWYSSEMRDAGDGDAVYEDGDWYSKNHDKGGDDNDDDGVDDDDSDGSWYFKRKSEEDQKDGSWYIKRGKLSDTKDGSRYFKARTAGDTKDESRYFKAKTNGDTVDGSWYFKPNKNSGNNDGSWYFRARTKSFMVHGSRFCSRKAAHDQNGNAKRRSYNRHSGSHGDNNNGCWYFKHKSDCVYSDRDGRAESFCSDHSFDP